LKNNLWDVITTHFQLGSHENEPSVQKKLQWLLKHPKRMTELSESAKPYLYYIFEEIKKRGMPAEIALIPMIESNYDPFEKSRRGAAGLWQMMPQTGAQLGLKISSSYDARKDVIASTKAALDHLSYLHSQFGTWLLAIAAYNAGEGIVHSAIRKNKQQKQPTNFWDLKLPYETKAYIPTLLALATVIRYPKHYKTRLTHIENAAYVKVIKLDKLFKLSRLAELSHTSVSLIHRLNPGFHQSTATTQKAQTILLPKKAAEALENLAPQS
jgi:membrane-bound lytic murein transglycosylase D